ncbi:MAG: LysM peptidoglycan-binding domain-containing protein [Desulfuromonadaceae bacterium]|nr:LysM peptidoglycan-binding domain-containing protein [Desulfuromonadaceae bacterium]MDD5104555.1 LysM peptidoglycan-binding domain-containing protein [Desulfuromonadaceae bacterium]
MKIKLLLTLLLAVPSMLYAAGQEEPTTYLIKQGDTLWGLSERFIKDPGYWPDMWSKNGQVTNPHFIYPGQKLRIFPDRIELVPKGQPVAAPARTNAPGPTLAVAVTETVQPVAAEKTYTLYGTEAFLAEKEFKPFGVVIGSQHDRIVTGVDDIVYTDIGAGRNARSGDKFSIFRRGETVKHPVSGEEVGDKIIPLGTLQLTDVEAESSRAIITKSSLETSPGALLLPYKDNRRREIPLKSAVTNLKGYIIESHSGVNIIAAGDVVYIDLGTAQGAEVGNMLYVVRDVTIDQKYAENHIDILPQELLGALVILETGSKTSSALVVKSIDAIYKGDRFVSSTR